MRQRGLTGVVSLLLVLPVVSMLAGARAPAAVAGERGPLSWTYRDPVHGFSLKMLKDLKAMPLKADERVVVCKFRDPKHRGATRGTLSAEIQVVRYDTTGKAVPVPADVPEELGRFLRKSHPSNIWDATVNSLWLDDAGETAVTRAKTKFETIQSRDEPAVQGKLWQFDVPLAVGATVHVTLAEFVKGDWAYGIYMLCGKPLARSYAKRFALIARSFRYLDSKAKDTQGLDALDGIALSPRKRAKIEKSMVKGWSLIVSPEKNYVVVYNTKGGRNHLLARVIAERLEMLRTQLFEQQFPSDEPIEAVCLVRVCGDKREYHAYGGPGGSAGYWSAVDEEIVLFDASRSKKPDDDTLAVLHTLAFKQYVHHALGGLDPHNWFADGCGEYYGGVKRKADTLLVGPHVWRVGTIRNAIAQGPRPFTQVKDAGGGVRKLWEPRGYTPLRDFVRFSQHEYLSYSTVNFAQGWSLIYFLREIVPKNKAHQAQWGHILQTYFETLKLEGEKVPAAKKPGLRKSRDRERARALEAAFRGVDWDALEAAWVQAIGKPR